MRHLTGSVLAVVMAAALYAGAGWGAGRIEALRAHGSSLATAPGVTALALPSRWRGGRGGRARYDDGFARPSETGLLQ